MPKFEVIVDVSEIYIHRYIVEAKDEDDARERVWVNGDFIEDEYVDTIDSQISEVTQMED